MKKILLLLTAAALLLSASLASRADPAPCSSAVKSAQIKRFELLIAKINYSKPFTEKDKKELLALARILSKNCSGYLADLANMFLANPPTVAEEEDYDIPN